MIALVEIVLAGGTCGWLARQTLHSARYRAHCTLRLRKSGEWTARSHTA